MPPRTRSAGPLPAGHQQLPSEPRKRTPRAAPVLLPVPRRVWRPPVPKHQFLSPGIDNSQEQLDFNKLHATVLAPRRQTIYVDKGIQTSSPPPVAPNVSAVQEDPVLTMPPAKTPTKRAREEDDDRESDRESKRANTEPRGIPIFQRNQSYFARNRARREQRALSARAPRFADAPSTVLRPTTERSSTLMKAADDKESTPSTEPEKKESTFSWLFGSARKLFTPAPTRTDEPNAQARERSTSPTPANNQGAIARLPSPDRLPSPTQPAPLTPDASQVFKRRRTGSVERPRPTNTESNTAEQDLITEQVEESKKRKIASNTFALTYDEEDDVDQDAEAAPATVAKQAPSTTPAAYKPPLRSAFRTTTAGRKTLRINETPTVKKVYGYYGPAGEYRGSTFADRTNNSFSSEESSINSEGKLWGSLSAEARDNTLMNMHNASKDKSQALFDSFSDPKPWVQPNHFELTYDDDSEDEDDTLPIEDDKVTTATPATPRMSHAELPDTPQVALTENGESAQTASMTKETEEAALKKAREQAQKYKPKTSSRLSTVEEKIRSRSSSPPISAVTEAEGGVPTKSQDQQAQQDPGTGPHPQPYPWSKPPRPSYSVEDPNYEPWMFENLHVGPDGMTDLQRRQAKDAAADAWAESLDWPESQTYVEAGLCSPYIDDLIRKTATEEGMQRAQYFYDQQFDDVQKWIHEEKLKGNRVALTWDNGQQEIEW